MRRSSYFFLLLALTGVAIAAPPKFVVRNLPEPIGGVARVTGIGDNGEVYGWADTGEVYATYWPSASRVVTMPRALPWANFEQLLFRTPAGEYYGRSDLYDGTSVKRSQMWRKASSDGPAEPLPFIGGKLNRFGRGVIAGLNGQTMYWDGTTFSDLPLPLGYSSTIVGVSDDGTVAGRTQATSDRFSFTIKNGVFRRVTEFDGVALMTAIDPDGTLVGLPMNNSYPPGSPVTLGPSGLFVYPEPGAFAENIYSAGAPYLSGTLSAGGRRAAIWTKEKRYLLDELATDSVVSLTSDVLVAGMNNRGQIVLNGSFPIIATPVPEPATMTALAVGALALVRKRRQA